MYGGYGFYYDWTYILVILGVIITMAASAKMNAAFSRYRQVPSSTCLTGRETAERILQANGIYDVEVRPVAGNLTDHYNPADRTVNLSEAVYNKTSVAAVGVAAHECGHAIQHHVGYVPLQLRSAIVPVVNVASSLSWPMILIGVILAGAGSLLGSSLISLGIVLFSAAVLFQLVTLPVEFNASARALKQLTGLGILPAREEKMARSVLSAAALTYVAAAAASLLQLLRLVILFGGNRRRD